MITAISFTTDYDFAFRRERLYIVNTASESIKVIALLRADKIRTYNLAEEITIRIAVKELKTLIKNSSEVTFYILKDDSRINGLGDSKNGKVRTRSEQNLLHIMIKDSKMSTVIRYHLGFLEPKNYMSDVILRNGEISFKKKFRISSMGFKKFFTPIKEIHGATVNLFFSNRTLSARGTFASTKVSQNMKEKKGVLEIISDIDPEEPVGYQFQLVNLLSIKSCVSLSDSMICRYDNNGFFVAEYKVGDFGILQVILIGAAVRK